MQRQFFSGNSVDQAVMTAARHFGVEPEKLAYKVRDKKTGFLNARRRVVIEVDPEKLLLTDEEIQARTKTVARPPIEDRRPEAPRQPEVPVHRAEQEIPVAPRVNDRYLDDDDADGQQAFGLVAESVERAPARTHAERPVQNERPAQNDRGPRQDNGRGGRKPRMATPAEGRRSQDRSSHGGGAERGGRGERGERGGQGRNRRGGPPQDRRGRGQNDRGPARKGGRGDERPRRDIVKVVEHHWKDGEWRELLTEEGDNVSREVLAFEKAIELILDVMDLDIEFSVSEGETFLIEFSGEDRDRLVAEEGRALKAIEHILPRIVRGMVGEALPCRVDCEDFQASREQELIELAKKTAEEVSRTHKPRMLPPMSPADRRIIHVTLMEDPDVDTLSEGDGFIKRIKIFPVRN